MIILTSDIDNRDSRQGLLKLYRRWRLRSNIIVYARRVASFEDRFCNIFEDLPGNLRYRCRHEVTGGDSSNYDREWRSLSLFPFPKLPPRKHFKILYQSRLGKASV